MSAIPTRWYKVLVNGHSCHGGNTSWPMPQGEEPGAFVTVTGELVMCSHGLHLTDWPAQWYAAGCSIFEAEPDEITAYNEEDRKGLCRSARLLREVVDHQELTALGIYLSGRHETKSGKSIASGSATVRAFDSATVEASGSATVEASGSATVEASGSATVRAFDSATVEASGSATVRAFDSAKLKALENVTIIVFHGEVQIEELGGAAVLIDRRCSKPIVTVAS